MQGDFCLGFVYAYVQGGLYWSHLSQAMISDEAEEVFKKLLHIHQAINSCTLVSFVS